MHTHKLKMDTYEPFAYCDCGAHVWKSEIERILNSHTDLLKALVSLEQTVRNFGNGWLTGEAQEIALNASRHAKQAIENAK